MQPFDFDRVMRRLPDWSQLAIGLGIVAGITTLKLTVGQSVMLIDFLFVPVIWVGWFARARWCGYLIAVVAAADTVVVAMVADTQATAGAATASGVARLIMYLLVLGLLGMMRKERAGHQHAAATDQKTGAANARAFQEVASAEVERSQRGGLTLSLAFLDIDDFKTINDSLGHAAGDHVLLGVSHVMRSMVRSVDTVARLGGDEFAILMPETEAVAARAVVERVRTEFSRLTVADGGPVHFSIGLVSFLRPADSLEEITTAADDLMYRAKNAGKDRVEQAERSGAPASILAASR